MAPNPAPEYEHGLAGHSACAAGTGGRGGFLSVLLSPSSRWTAGIYVEGTGTWEWENSEVPKGHGLFLSAHGGDGGDGGDGGIGVDGQDGGPGRDSEDATRYAEARAGHQGKKEEGDVMAPAVRMAVSRESLRFLSGRKNMNLLIAVLWAVNGGNCGARGAHGRGGRDFPGGRGVAGIEWTVKVAIIKTVENSAGRLVPEAYYETDFYTQSPGWNGSSGYNGSQPFESPYNGAPGRDVVRNNG
ncbi:hypothetical protein DL770_001532 [Monosporascus sp. CRB-9-2]|nr:hypothetical protein DL770_001532 [Monosporascus sp. CRB-9-2]